MADIMFVLDVTGSTGSTDFARHGIRPFMERLAGDGIDARVGLTIFRDEKPKGGELAGAKDDPWSYTFRSGEYYTSDADEFRDLVSRIREEGGGDAPENSMEALRLAADRKGRPGAIVAQILMTDDFPKPWPDYKDNLLRTRKHLQDRRVRQLHAITGAGQQKIYAELWDREAVEAKLSGKHHDNRVIFDRRTAEELLRSIARDIAVEARREAGTRD